MAERRSAIFKSEKYMDDVVSSVFSNLHNAAKRKNSYVWSVNKYDYLDTIWGDATPSKTDKILDDVSCTERNPKIGWEASIGKHNKTVGATANKMHEYDMSTAERASKNELDVFEKNHDRKLASHQTTKNAPMDYEILNDFSKQDPSCSKSINCGQNIAVRNDDIESHSIHQSESEKELKVYISQEGTSSREVNAEDATETMPENFSGHFRGTYTRRRLKALRHRLQQNISKENRNLCQENIRVNSDVISKKDTLTYKQRSNLQKEELQSQLTVQNFNSALKEIKSLGSKRTRHDSESSGNSSPLLKKLSGRTENSKEHRFDTKESLLKSLISVRIIGDDQCPEFTISLADFKRIKKKFPKLSEVFLGIDAGEKEIQFCSDAVKTVFRFLFNPPYNFDTMPEGRTAVEVLAATKAWDIYTFHPNFLQHFLKKLNEDNFTVIYPLAIHFGLNEVRDACKAFIPEGESLNDRRLYRQRKCLVEVSTYSEPLEFCISLRIARQVLKDNFNRDISNDIIFESMEGSYVITGFHVLLNISEDNGNRESANLSLTYSVKTENENDKTEEAKLSKVVRSIIAVNFKRKIIVKPKQKLRITLETTIKPYLCFASNATVITERTQEHEFKLTLRSNYKVENSDKRRFIIGKLLYNSMAADK